MKEKEQEEKVEEKVEVEDEPEKTAFKNPNFFEHKKHRIVQFKKESVPVFEEEPNSFLDKEVKLKFKIRPVLTSSVIIVVLLAVFILGRVSVDSSTSGAVVSEAAEASTAEAAVAEADAAEEKTSFLSKLVPDFIENTFSYLVGFDQTAENVTDAAVQGSAVAEETVKAVNDVSAAAALDTAESEAAEADAAEETEAAVVEADAQEVITTYSNVALAIDGVVLDWKTTWGKVTDVKYTIKNNEAGIVKPDHFGIVLAGYDDFKKEASVPPSSRTLKAKTSASSIATINGGYAYSEATLGSLASVVVTLTLYDATDNVMATTTKAVSLQG